jgi:hypothetical protein
MSMTREEILQAVQLQIAVNEQQISSYSEELSSVTLRTGYEEGRLYGEFQTLRKEQDHLRDILKEA